MSADTRGKRAAIAGSTLSRVKMAEDTSFRAQLRRGFLGPVPLWPGDVPFGIAYALVSRASGFSGVEILLSSLLVNAGSAQLVMVTLYSGGPDCSRSSSPPRS